MVRFNFTVWFNPIFFVSQAEILLLEVFSFNIDDPFFSNPRSTLKEYIS